MSFQDAPEIAAHRTENGIEVSVDLARLSLDVTAADDFLRPVSTATWPAT